jgi:hypothetical protein
MGFLFGMPPFRIYGHINIWSLTYDLNFMQKDKKGKVVPVLH